MLFFSPGINGGMESATRSLLVYGLYVWTGISNSEPMVIVRSLLKSQIKPIRKLKAPLTSQVAAGWQRCITIIEKQCTRYSLAQESNRAYCVQFSLYLAGVLNRTLLYVEIPAFNGKKIDRHIYFDCNHTRKCFGDHTVETVAEYKQKHGHPPVIDEIRLLLPSEHAYRLQLPNGTSDLENADPLLLRALQTSVESNDATVKSGIQIEKAFLKRWGHLFHIDDIIQEYGKLRGTVLFIGEGFFMRMSTNASNLGGFDGHLPFSRLPSCPNALAIQPHPIVFDVADLIVRNTPILQGKYLGLHMRLGDFKEYEGSNYHDASSTAHKLLAALKSTGINSIFLATNGKPKEVGTPTQTRDAFMLIDECCYAI